MKAFARAVGCFCAVAIVYTAVIVCAPGSARALPPPVAGTYVPQLAAFDQAMIDVMTANDISAGMLAVMKNGVPVYHRAFGWKDEARTQSLPLDTIMRLASVTKPLTAASVRTLIGPGKPLALNSQIFSLDEPGTGILDHTAFGATPPDQRLKDITVEHLLQHRGGWDRTVAGDHTYRERQIASAMRVPNTPGRDNTMRWILGQPLQFAPGTDSEYSNIGYMALGMVTEEVTGKNHLEVIRQNVLAPIGVDPNLVVGATTFAEDNDPREPFYDSAGSTATNAYYNGAGDDLVVDRAYGGFDLEARIGQGGVVASPLALLEFLDKYQVAGNNIGGPRPAPGNWTWTHTGSYTGTNTIASQRGDGVNYVVLFNKAAGSGDIGTAIGNLLKTSIAWPTLDVTLGDVNIDGFVDIFDVNLISSHWGEVGVLSADANHDGVVNIFDVNLVSAHWRTAPPTATPVPEPGTMALVGTLLLMAGIAAAARSRRACGISQLAA